MIKTHDIEKLKTELVLKLAIEEKVWRQAQDRTYNEIASNLSIKGFRKGKAPKSVSRSYINQMQVLEKSIDKILKTLGKKAFELINEADQKEIISAPSFNVSKISDSELEITLRYPLTPEVKLADLSKFNVKYPTIKVDKKQIEEKLKSSQKSLTMSKEVERPSKKGDKIVFDFKGLVDGETFEGGAAKDHEYIVGSKKFLPEFEKALVGMKKGEVKNITFSFPKDYNVKELRDQEVEFELTMKKVTEISTPKIDDQLALELAIKDVKNLAQLKKHYEKELIAQNKEAAKRKFEENIFAWLSDNSKIEVPTQLIEQESVNVKQEFEGRLKQQGMSLKDFTNMLQRSEEDMAKEWNKQAESKLKIMFINDALVKKLKFAASKEEISKKYEEYAVKYKMKREEIEKVLPEAQIKSQAIHEKFLAHFGNLAKKLSGSKPSPKKPGHGPKKPGKPKLKK